jgi:FtsZ-interacting cell division protein ZipA
MEPTSQNNTLRSLLIFVIIGAVLLGAVILGVRFARGRSDQLAANNAQTQQQQPANTAQTDAQRAEEQRKAAEQKAADDRKKAEETAAASAAQKAKDEQAARDKKAADDKKAAEEKAKVAAAQNNAAIPQQTPAQVPQTGAEDIMLPVVILAALVFAVTNYVQSRRRLAPAK